MSDRAWLVLADGTVFEGRPFGARGVTTGEAVFTTAMTGYQEVLTDPSYYGQIVTMTAPEIGNVGVNAEDTEAVGDAPRVAGLRRARREPGGRRAGAPRSRSTPTCARTASSASPESTRASSPATCATRARRTAPSAPRPPEALLRRAREPPRT